MSGHNGPGRANGSLTGNNEGSTFSFIDGLKAVPEAIGPHADMLSSLAAAAEAELPTHPAIAAELRALATVLRAGHDTATNLHPDVQRAMQADYDRVINNPRGGNTHIESKADLTRKDQ
jgi:hypothetical protein